MTDNEIPDIPDRIPSAANLIGYIRALRIAVKHDGGMTVNPEPSEILREDGELILVGDTEAVDRFTSWKPRRT